MCSVDRSSTTESCYSCTYRLQKKQVIKRDCYARPLTIIMYHVLIFYPRDAMLARVIAIATCLSVRPSVCLSVCLSVMRRYCVKTKKASVMISSPPGSPKTLVFWRQIWSPNSKGFPPNGGLKQGSVGKIQRFASCNVSISSTGY